MVKTTNLQAKEEWVMKKLNTFYHDPCNLKQFLQVVSNNKKGKLSLRLIDWFITNYAKKNNISYSITRPNGQVERFLPYQRYRDQLTSYPKKLFDPFCRGKVFDYIIPTEFNSFLNIDDETSLSVETAVCQLHFFKWAIENLMLSYISSNLELIYNDMQSFCSNKHGSQLEYKVDVGQTKRQLSQSVHEKMVSIDEPLTVSIG